MQVEHWGVCIPPIPEKYSRKVFSTPCKCNSFAQGSVLSIICVGSNEFLLPKSLDTRYSRYVSFIYRLLIWFILFNFKILLKYLTLELRMYLRAIISGFLLSLNLLNIFLLFGYLFFNIVNFLCSKGLGTIMEELGGLDIDIRWFWMSLYFNIYQFCFFNFQAESWAIHAKFREFFTPIKEIVDEHEVFNIFIIYQFLLFFVTEYTIMLSGD